jgi:hypothetical protein
MDMPETPEDLHQMMRFAYIQRAIAMATLQELLRLSTDQRPMDLGRILQGAVEMFLETAPDKAAADEAREYVADEVEGFLEQWASAVSTNH